MVCGSIGYGGVDEIRRMYSLLLGKGFDIVDHIVRKGMDYSDIRDFRDEKELSQHYEAMKNAVKEITDIGLDVRTFYLLEGMPINEMAIKILELKGYDMKQTERIGIVAQTIGTRKKQIFLEMKQIPESFKGVKELIHDSLEGCLKAVVTGSSKQELEAIIEHDFGKDVFDVAINVHQATHNIDTIGFQLNF